MATPPPLGLYIHLPWCERKCPYCDFNSHEARDIPEAAYVDALLRDLEDELPRAQGRTVDTLFIGGGTPSLFSPGAIARLLSGIGARLPLSPDLEATMEANPGSAEAEKFAGFRAAGINRLSLGIQSFHDEQLRALGRVHSADQAHAAIAMARAAGFDNFNLDLMHGLPDQDGERGREDLRIALSYEPPHLSWYQLTIEPNTVFHKRPPALPVEDTLADIQEQGEAILRGGGLSQYEVSAWSRPGRECRHNLNYWSFGDYLGIGAGAHGKITHGDGRIERYAKRRQPGDYLAAGAGGFQASQRWLGVEELPGEYMLNALRLAQGTTLSNFEKRTGLDSQVIEPLLDRLASRGLVEAHDNVLRCTPTGWRFLDSVVGEFF
ncbi:radical SAM family heme chaperone HemW [Parahaliea mediterranea]|uniref:Heme chaperone HemW n=1 Tax=Parahaliea mediterranea TaxID=651086 RepID=A0A939DFU7_9GAMM|nr:radical SAM family heme chaperone HemW [Parahaliea mediterranea]MBN7797274.1 radical SAM family heme chaperone HemW [Parahaliea mediterranea]